MYRHLLFLVDETGLPDLGLNDRGMLLMNPLSPPYTPEETTIIKSKVVGKLKKGASKQDFLVILG